jgi:hypothetical protein
MRVQWRIVLPVVGLALFSVISYHSFHAKAETQRTPTRYFWWSLIRLDSDPANKRGWDTTWDLGDRWVDPGLLEKFLIISAIPAFVLGGFVVAGLGRLGINQVSSFMFVMPVLIFTWYYLIGWLLDRWIRKRSQPSGPGNQ